MAATVAETAVAVGVATVAATLPSTHQSLYVRTCPRLGPSKLFFLWGVELVLRGLCGNTSGLVLQGAATFGWIFHPITGSRSFTGGLAGASLLSTIFIARLTVILFLGIIVIRATWPIHYFFGCSLSPRLQVLSLVGNFRLYFTGSSARTYITFKGRARARHRYDG